MQTIKLSLIYGLTLIISLGSCAANNSQKKEFDNSTVSTLVLDKYLGKWYEIARFDHSFERDMQGVTANYSIREDGLIKVINSGYKGSLEGKYKETEGKAKIPDPDVPSKLKVAFFWNFWGDYYIMELADDYRYALIGSSTEKYLWILSRTKMLLPEDQDYLITRIKDRGYDESKLIWVDQ